MAVGSIGPELKRSISQGPQTALEEYRQAASITPTATPRTLSDLIRSLTCQRDFDPLVWDSEWAEWDSQWRKIARIDRKTPTSWSLSDIAITAGCHGILIPSLQHAGGTNVVVFSANLDAGDSIEVHDPDGPLPKDQSSWR